MNIYLIGFMGSGKSSTGRKIASCLQWHFTDTDRVVEEQEGATVPEIFEKKGEAYFRKAETTALRTVAEQSRTVVACGGGTPCSAENIEIMKATGVIVYLKLPAGALASRLLKSKAKRPLLRETDAEGMTEKVREMLHRRTAWYEQADAELDGMNDSVEEMTSAISSLVRSRGAYL